MSRLVHAVFGVTALVRHFDGLESLTGQISDYLVGVHRQHFKNQQLWCQGWLMCQFVT